MTTDPRSLPLGPAMPLADALLEARAACMEAAQTLLTVPDNALNQPWSWRADENDVRYAYYNLYESLEGVEVAARRTARDRPEASAILDLATAARWDLHGLLAPLTDADLDREPGEGEWTLRQTLGHMIVAQRSFSIRTAWFVERARTHGDRPSAMPATGLNLPAPAEEEAGSLDDLRRRLDEALDVGIGLLGSLENPADLGAPSLWMRYDVDARFRLHRSSSHLREHTIQVEKTLAMLGRAPGEVERLVRLVLAAYGRLEGACLGVPLDGALGERVRGVARLLREQARDVAAVAHG